MNKELEQQAREPIVHELKCHPGPYDATERGDKPFEFRKDDREPRFESGDTLWLRRWDPNNHAVVVDVHGDKEHPGVEYVPRGYTGQQCRRTVTYIIREGFGIPEGYCIMGLAHLEAQSKPIHGEVATVPLSPEMVELLQEAKAIHLRDHPDEETDPSAYMVNLDAMIDRLLGIR